MTGAVPRPDGRSLQEQPDLGELGAEDRPILLGAGGRVLGAHPYKLSCMTWRIDSKLTCVYRTLIRGSRWPKTSMSIR